MLLVNIYRFFTNDIACDILNIEARILSIFGFGYLIVVVLIFLAYPAAGWHACAASGSDWKQKGLRWRLRSDLRSSIITSISRLIRIYSLGYTILFSKFHARKHIKMAICKRCCRNRPCYLSFCYCELKGQIVPEGVFDSWLPLSRMKTEGTTRILAQLVNTQWIFIISQRTEKRE